jgi:cytoskeleton protein RodZ
VGSRLTRRRHGVNGAEHGGAECGNCDTGPAPQGAAAHSGQSGPAGWATEGFADPHAYPHRTVAGYAGVVSVGGGRARETLGSSQSRPIAISAGDFGVQTVESKIMFELGSSLREARVRRGIELAQVAAETRIRTRYLQALEDERFELLPGSVYARGFLRAYADYLGLDGQLFVDEYNARFSADALPPAPLQLELQPWPLRRYGIATAVLFLALVGALVAWQLSSSAPRPAGSRAALAKATGTLAAATRRRARPTRDHSGRARQPIAVALDLRATRGRCWLSVRQGSEQGRHLFEGTLEQGASRRFAVGRLWIRIGAPWNLEARLAGRPLSLPQTVANLVVTASGIRAPTG